MRSYLALWCTTVAVVAPAAAQENRSRLIASPDAFGTLVNPNCSHCIDESRRRATELRDNDRVLCWTRGKYDGGAIPIRFFLNPYRVISDTYGVFVFDPEAGYARGFKPSVDFTFHGWRNGIMVMRHKDGTLFSCLSGVAFDGPRRGERLVPWPTAVADWGWYLKQYPGGVAYHMFDKYKPIELSDKPHPDSVASRGKPDPRLPAEEAVLGVEPPSLRARPRAYRLSELEKAGAFAALPDRFECGNPAIILWQGATRTAAAYRPQAERRKPADKLGQEGELTDARDVAIVADGASTDLPFVDKKTSSRFDVLGRCREGELKGSTLAALDSVQVKWFAWAAEHPETTIHHAPMKEEKPPPTETPPAATEKKANESAREVAGTAEFLRAIPKHFATLQAVDPERKQVTLLIEGEKLAKVWPLAADAEVKVRGWWGRLDQLQSGERVWVWLKTDRQKRPLAVFMLADEVSEQDIHGGPALIKAVTRETITYQAGKQPPRELQVGKTQRLALSDQGAKAAPVAELKPDDRVYVQSTGDQGGRLIDAALFANLQKQQRAELRQRWERDGLPGSVAFVHTYSGELDVMLDHEAMFWGRSLQPGDKVALAELPTDVPAAVKSVRPWRERTQVRLVVNGLDIAAFMAGERTRLRMKAPPMEAEESGYPPDLDRPRSRDERIEWFLASIYCTCPVPGDICTGDFYTLASCNPNGCGSPNVVRRKVAEKIDQGMNDRQIFDDLRAERGPLLRKPHLQP